MFLFTFTAETFLPLRAQVVPVWLLVVVYIGALCEAYFASKAWPYLKRILRRIIWPHFWPLTGFTRTRCYMTRTRLTH